MTRLDALAADGTRLWINEGERGLVDLVAKACDQHIRITDYCKTSPLARFSIERVKQNGLPVSRKAANYVTNEVANLKFQICKLLLFRNQQSAFVQILAAQTVPGRGARFE